MAIKSINELSLFITLDGGNVEGVPGPPFPMVLLLTEGEVLGAIKFSIETDVWRVRNVVAVEGYGPTIYKIIMQLSGDTGIAPQPAKHASGQCFIVERSKRIWRRFSESTDVKQYYLNNHLPDDYLNSKYICCHPCLNISLAEKNLGNYLLRQIRQSFLSERSWRLKTQSLLETMMGKSWTCTHKMYKQQIKERKPTELELIWNKGRPFLDESVRIHRN